MHYLQSKYTCGPSAKSLGTFCAVVMGSAKWHTDHKFNPRGWAKSSQVHCDLCILKKLVFFTINRTGIFLNIARRIFLTKRGVIENARVGDVRGRGQASDYVGQHVPWWSYLQRFDFCICIYVFVFFG